MMGNYPARNERHVKAACKEGTVGIYQSSGIGQHEQAARFVGQASHRTAHSFGAASGRLCFWNKKGPAGR